MIDCITDMNSQGPNEPATFLGMGLLTNEQFRSLADRDKTAGNQADNPLHSWLAVLQETEPCRTSPIANRFDADEDFEFESLNEHEMEAKRARDEDDIEALKGNYHGYRRQFVAKTSRRISVDIKALLQRTLNLWDIPHSHRGAVYQYLKDEACKEQLKLFRQHLLLYEHDVEALKIIKWQSAVKLVKIKNIKLIGCTTTGLSKYRAFLAAVQPKTLLIEEASETLEGTVLAGMFDSIEHLVLVGGHKQLRARCNLDFLEVNYFLGISLFERLTNNRLEYISTYHPKLMLTVYCNANLM